MECLLLQKKFSWEVGLPHKAECWVGHNSGERTSLGINLKDGRYTEEKKLSWVSMSFSFKLLLQEINGLYINPMLNLHHQGYALM